MIFGVAAGLFEILNTGIGWHLASGRWMVEHRAILTHNPFTLGADGTQWLNHEWLFQVAVALIERLGAGPGLVGLRVGVTVGLVFLLIRFGRKAGLSSGSALVLACLCVAGARMRFYVRPELATLFLLPLGVSLYLARSQRRTVVTAAAVAAISAVGVNLHAGILVLPAILGALVAAEALTTIINRRSPLIVISSGTAIVGAAIAGALLNPWGWRVLAAPFRLAHLVGKAWVPNPEWISPGPTDVPELYIALIVAWALFIFRERQPIRWMLLAVISALALRYVRNVGLFFTVLPLAVAPALAGISTLRHVGRRTSLIASVTALCLGLLMIGAPGHPFGWGFSTDRYPVGASTFLEQTGLLGQPVYNDVRFGGWLIGRYYPPFQAFIDDRNEIHEDLLQEMWEIHEASSPGRWQALLDSYGIETALLRYHEPLSVQTPDGKDLGQRGFSALWFPDKRWALVFWDDTAMVLVDREKTRPELVEAFEYQWVRPDDSAHLAIMAQDDPVARAALITEIKRKLHEDPECHQALWLLSQLSAKH
ncbi:MAG: hypothetical protein DRQ40_10490 [Gammaproteobacteria bacterium]|nr:MAG: hypothetical protein DRQ40_10490 [Gammaproteobacteria bacterium]